MFTLDRSCIDYHVYERILDLVSEQSRAKNSISVLDTIPTKSTDDLDMFLLS